MMTIKSNTFLFISLIAIFISGKAQTVTHAGNPENSYESIVKGDTVKVLGNNIMIVYQDTKNNYWYGSWQDGLYKYDGRSIIHFTTKHGLPHNRIDEIKEDKKGSIYINTVKGICQINGQYFTTLTENTAADNAWKLSPDDLWFKSSEFSGYVYRYDGNKLHKLQLPKTKLGEDYILNNPSTVNPYAVYTVYTDIKENIWFGTASLGVCRFDGKSVDWISEQDVTELHKGPANGVRSIIEDENGDFWFNTEYRYSIYNITISPKNKQDIQTFYSRTKSIGSLDGKKDGTLNEYLSITKDNNNDLWIATYNDGVWKYDGVKITHYPVKFDSKNITVFSIYKDNNGDLWLGTHENGVFKFNGQTFEKFKP